MIKPHWQQIIEQEQLQDYYCQLQAEVAKQRGNGITVYPPENDVYNAFSAIDLPDVKVVIFGQDPYHGEGQAHGLAFSVQNGIKVPPSLVNIYKELTTDIDGFVTPVHGNLAAWAQQGVLLLNTVLTVQQGQAHSHAKLGWEMFTDKIIEQINLHNDGCVFILWGAHAQKKGRNIDNEKHLVLNGPHPSPLSVYRGFYGSKPFSKANVWLANYGKSAIDWRLTNTNSIKFMPTSELCQKS